MDSFGGAFTIIPLIIFVFSFAIVIVIVKDHVLKYLIAFLISLVPVALWFWYVYSMLSNARWGP